MRLTSISVIGRAYSQLTEVSRGEYANQYSLRLQRYFNNLTNFEYAETVKDWLVHQNHVLVIGDAGGRDAGALAAQGKRVVTMDIAPQLDATTFVIADAEGGLPFADGTFDGVVMAEVIEHLFRDIDALREIRRVLQPRGRLVLTTPIGNDEPDYHVRVYSLKTLRRLLAHAGFDVQEMVEKGGGFAEFDGTTLGGTLKHGVQWFIWRVSGRTRYRQWNAVLRLVDLRISKILPSIHRHSRHYGVFVLATPSRRAQTETVRSMNAAEFAYRA